MEDNVTEVPVLASAEEVAESMTGFDEIAVEKRFGNSVSELNPTTTLRALAFTLHRREGQSDADAYKTAMGATLKAVVTLFRADESEDEGEGKG